ncbi:GNAT family N-acetyltransferase [Anaerostipes sp.]|uniref:GNAT family N-acetyltransferase n=1 Tax=Anaerostipes sp. TaxID=1872530 RepID=UPI0025BD9098|nr:GNAT family N-acetyltransferase [Anaerostipes sp.]MBS7009326.1 N-acetyltransferase [Anaerostipes sp.]
MIRKARQDDVTRITEIYNEVAANSAATFDLHAKSLEDRAVWMEEHKGNHPLLVYEADGTVAGYAGLSPYQDKEAFDATVELSIYLDSRYRGRGIGTKLMDAILSLARSRDDIHTVVSVITGGNIVSQKLHESFGFCYCGTIREAGYKFGKYLDIDTYQLIVRNK